MRRRKSRVVMARRKAEDSHLAALWEPIKAAMDEEFRAWWTGQSPPVHPGTPPLSTLETAQTRENTGPVHPSTLSTHEKQHRENFSGAAGEPVNREPVTRAHTRVSNIGGQVGQGGPDQQRRGLAAVHPQAGRADRVDICRYCGERIPASAPAITYADSSLAHVACYERAASRPVS